MTVAYWLQAVLSVVVCVGLGFAARRLINRWERR